MYFIHRSSEISPSLHALTHPLGWRIFPENVVIFFHDSSRENYNMQHVELCNLWHLSRALHQWRVDVIHDKRNKSTDTFFIVFMPFYGSLQWVHFLLGRRRTKWSYHMVVTMLMMIMIKLTTMILETYSKWKGNMECTCAVWLVSSIFLLIITYIMYTHTHT